MNPSVSLVPPLRSIIALGKIYIEYSSWGLRSKSREISSRLLFIEDLNGIKVESISLIKINESETTFRGRLEDNLNFSFNPITVLVIFEIFNESISVSFLRSNLTVKVFIG